MSFSQLFYFSQFNFQTRARELDELREQNPLFDIAILGGGITGAAIARDAALRGLRVLVVEKGDFASGTSSRSSKLVHGGVRYLEHGEFKLVFESTQERGRLWKLAPELVEPLAFLFPAYKKSRVPLWMLRAGLWLYDCLALFRLPGLHRHYNPAKTHAAEKLLRTEELTGLIFYWDGATHDALLTLANLCDARQNGASIFSRVRLEGVKWNPNEAREPQGHELSLVNEMTGEKIRARARTLVCAAGPWTDFIPEIVPLKRRLLATTRGSHIVVPGTRLPTQHAVVLIHPKDERVLFSIPWDDCTVIGTTDLFDEGSPDKVAISSEEIDYLLEAANYFYPTVALERKDVISTWSGLRPLLAPPDSADAASISREHHIEWREPGMLIIAGGKLTTHREMAEQALDRIAEETKTWPKPLGTVFAASETMKHALPSIGSKLHDALVPSEERLRAILRTQMVLTIEDLFVRRTDIFYREPSNGWSLLPGMKAVLCEEMRWDDSEWTRQCEAYARYVNENVWAPLGRTPPTL